MSALDLLRNIATAIAPNNMGVLVTELGKLHAHLKMLAATVPPPKNWEGPALLERIINFFGPDYLPYQKVLAHNLIEQGVQGELFTELTKLVDQVYSSTASAF